MDVAFCAVVRAEGASSSAQNIMHVLDNGGDAHQGTVPSHCCTDYSCNIRGLNPRGAPEGVYGTAGNACGLLPRLEQQEMISLPMGGVQLLRICISK